MLGWRLAACLRQRLIAPKHPMPRTRVETARAGQARAAFGGRSYVLPDDVKDVAVPVLAHRIIVSPGARLRELSAERIVQEIVRNTPVPGGDFGLATAQEAQAA